MNPYQDNTGLETDRENVIQAFCMPKMWSQKSELILKEKDVNLCNNSREAKCSHFPVIPVIKWNVNMLLFFLDSVLLVVWV